MASAEKGDAMEEAIDHPVTLTDVDQQLEASGRRHIAREDAQTVTVESARGPICLTRTQAVSTYAIQHP